MGMAWAAGNEACKAEAEGERAGLGRCWARWVPVLCTVQQRNRRKPNAAEVEGFVLV